MKKSLKKAKLNIVVVAAINVLLLYSLFSFLFYDGLDEGTVTAASEMRVEADPNTTEGIIYTTPETALSQANNQLDDMTVGDIETIDNEDSFNAGFYRDYEMGDIYYWELYDSDTIVCLDAVSGEIVLYANNIHRTGSMSSSQIESQATTIANGFCALPGDRSGAVTTYLENVLTEYDEDPEDPEQNNTTVHNLWTVEFTRTKSGINAEDHIRLVLAPNGDLVTYRKYWNMDLQSLETYYSVTKPQAEITALNAAGAGSTVHSSEKMIVRPNYSWSTNIEFGNDPCAVWEVYVEDSDENLCIYHVHRTSNTIIGGDFVDGYYET